jgi:glycosyltransferase involved in cell wall biosynthesis
MLIAVDGSRAFLKRRTGIEEYSYQTIRHLRGELKDARVVLYVRADQSVDFELPANWQVKKLWAPRFWTQVRLSLQMLFDRPDVLFVPAHTVPLIHPKRTVVVVHGLEYEFCPEAYSRWSRLYMHASIGFSCRAAERVVCVSENTKRDVMRVYGVAEEKVSVMYEGYERMENGNLKMENDNGKWKITEPYFLFIGRLEERKNIVRIIDAFESVKERYDIPHKLVLAGKPGFGYERIEKCKMKSEKRGDILELGYVDEEEKWRLLEGAEAFLFPTLYEGFGIPVLEAQSVGTPVITSDRSSLPEVAGDGALLVDPEDVEAIAEAMHRLVSENELKNAIIQKGLENAGRFSWKKCARELAATLEGK